MHRYTLLQVLREEYCYKALFSLRYWKLSTLLMCVYYPVLRAIIRCVFLEIKKRAVSSNQSNENGSSLIAKLDLPLSLLYIYLHTEV